CDPRAGGRPRSEWRVLVAALGSLRHNLGQPGPGPFQPLGADSGQALAALPQLQRLLEGQATGLEALDQFGQLVARLLVGRPLGLRLWLRGTRTIAAIGCRHALTLVQHRRAIGQPGSTPARRRAVTSWRSRRPS